jgi:uncharacterized protein DUF4823
MFRRRVLALLAVAIVTSCSASYSKVNTGGADRAAVHLDAARPVLVALPADGNFDAKSYPGSGVTVAQQTAAAFAKHASRVDLASSGVKDRSGLLEAARRSGAGYLVIPTITHWEHRATEWSGRPSRAAVGIEIVDVSNGETAASTLLESRSRIMSLTGTSPESLMPHLIGPYVDGLY